MKKHRTTLLTRLILFLLIFTPIAYFLIKYLQGEGGLKGARSNSTSVIHESKSTSDLTIELQREEIELLKKQLDSCRATYLIKSDN